MELDLFLLLVFRSGVWVFLHMKIYCNLEVCHWFLIIFKENTFRVVNFSTSNFSVFKFGRCL